MPTDPVNKSSLINPLQVGQKRDAGAAAKARSAGEEADKSKVRGSNDAGVNVSLSPKAREIANARAKALDIARGTPDVREDRVAALKKQIEEGTYKIDSGGIADGILREAIKERLAETEER